MSPALNQHVEPMNVNDKEIFLAIRKHPEQGFRKLMAAYMQPVYWHIRRMVSVHADADGQHSETGSLRAWIFRIATNEALRLLGRRAGRTTLSLDDASAEVLALKQDEWFDSSDKLSAKLQQAIHTLPAKQQATFNLRYYDDLSYEEIAEVTASTEAAAKANYHVAKKKIIDYMHHND